MSEPIRVVIIDDNIDARQLATAAINRVEGFEMVAAADNVRDLGMILKSEAPDVVLIDWHLPAMDDGGAVIESRRLAPEVKVIVYTSAAVNKTRRRQMLELGADEVVEKGDPLSLVSTIEEVMR